MGTGDRGLWLEINAVNTTRVFSRQIHILNITSAAIIKPQKDQQSADQ